jgi:hypothetical protein
MKTRLAREPSEAHPQIVKCVVSKTSRISNEIALARRALHETFEIVASCGQMTIPAFALCKASRDIGVGFAPFRSNINSPE